MAVSVRCLGEARSGGWLIPKADIQPSSKGYDGLGSPVFILGISKASTWTPR